MFPDFALQARDEVVPNSLANDFRRIVPASTGATLRFILRKPLEEWNHGVEIYACGAVARALHCLRSKDSQRKMQAFLPIENQNPKLLNTRPSDDLKAPVHSAPPGDRVVPAVTTQALRVRRRRRQTDRLRTQLVSRKNTCAGSAYSNHALSAPSERKAAPALT